MHLHRAISGTRVYEVRGRHTLNKVARLQEQDRLRVGESESILQVEVALSVEVETLPLGLCETWKRCEEGL